MVTLAGYGASSASTPESIVPVTTMPRSGIRWPSGCAFSLEVAVRRDGQALVRLRLRKPRLQVGGDGVDRVGPREELLRRRLHRGELHERLAELRRISRLLAVIRLPLRFDRGRGAVALDGKIAEHDGLGCGGRSG